MNMTTDILERIEKDGVDALHEIDGRHADTLRVLVEAPYIAVGWPAAIALAPNHVLHIEGASFTVETRVSRNIRAAIFRCSPIEEDSSDAS